MKLTLNNKELGLMSIVIDFFASVYDLAIVFFAFIYDLIYAFVKIMLVAFRKLVLKIRTIGPLKVLIDFFAFQYDLVYDFILFLREYIRWITDIRSTRTSSFETQTKESIQVENPNPLNTQ